MLKICILCVKMCVSYFQIAQKHTNVKIFIYIHIYLERMIDVCTEKIILNKLTIFLNRSFKLNYKK